MSSNNESNEDSKDEKKRKRPDVAKKKAEAKKFQETVVVCCLLRTLKGFSMRKEFQDAVQKRVLQSSIKTWNASIALNLLVREACNGKEDISTVQFPTFWDITFIRQLMLGTKDSIKPYKEIKELHERYPCLVDTGRSLGDRNIYTEAAKKLSTNVKNHLKVNFPNVMKKLLYKGFNVTKSESFEIQKNIYGWNTVRKKKKKKENNVEEEEDSDPVDEEKVAYIIKYLRNVMDLQDPNTISKKWFDEDMNLSHMLKLFIDCSRRLEENNEKIISILPICKIKSHFITIDTFSFVGILKELNVYKDLVSKFKKEEYDDKLLWQKIVNVNKVQDKDKQFTCTVDTNGYSLNIHFKRPKISSLKDVSQKTKTSFEGKRVLGVDPGRENILTIVEEIANGIFKTYTLTRKRYYSESGISISNNRSNRWNKTIKSELNMLSLYSPKSVKVESFLDYLGVIKFNSDALWNEYTKKRWQDQRFRLYGGKKRVFARFLNSLGPSENIVLAFGNAKFAPGGKGEQSVPTTRAYKECSYRFLIILVDEFRTSKINWKTLETLDVVMKKDKANKMVSVRGLLWCRSTIDKEGKFVNRDHNAAINILRCATLPNRPDVLCRNKVNGKLVQRIGKIIHR